MIQIPLLNPIRFISLADINAGFDGNFSIYQTNNYTDPKCYLQKWQQSDTLFLQVISDSEPTPVLIKDADNKLIDTINWLESDLVFPDFPDLAIYEIQYLFSNCPVGKYQLYFSAGDEEYESEPICVQALQPKTILIKYKNRENNYSTVFATNIEFQFRVEAEIKNFKPKNDRITYNDQIQNLTQLFSVAYRQFTLIIGGQKGVSEWALDKVNQIQQCDQVSYDGIYYQPISDAEIEPIQPEFYDLLGGTIEIQPVDNNFIKFVTQPDGSGVQTFTPVQKVIPKYNIAGDFTIAGIFKYLSKIESIDVIKTGADYLLNIGITPGGGEIVSNWNVDESRNDIEVNYLFDSTQIVYFSGTGLNATALFVNYLQLDEPPVPLSPVASPNIGKCFGGFFFEIDPGDLAAAFDLATGIGLSNSDWKDWVLAGTNGTAEMAGRLPIGWDRADTLTIGTDVGSTTITIGKANLPAEPLDIRVSRAPGSDWRTSGGSGRPITNVGAIGISDPEETGKTKNLGLGTPLPFTPLSLICVYVIKVA